MTALREPDLTVGTEGAFITEFVSHVAVLTVYDKNRLMKIERLRRLLLAALAEGPTPGWDAWRALYRGVCALVEDEGSMGGSRASEYMRAFLRENSDLGMLAE